MPIPAKPYAEWTTEDVAQLTEEPRAREHARLDFKADLDLLSQEKQDRDKARLSLLKDVAAMANGVGGAVIIGVRESSKPGEEGIAAKVVGLPKGDAERLEKAIKSLVDTHLDVRPGPLRIYPPIETSAGPDRCVVIVQIPQNTYSLSMVTYDDVNQFWVRRSRDNRLMTADEIQYFFERATRVRESAEATLAAVRDEALDGGLGPLMWMSGVPIQRSRDNIPVDSARMREIINSSSFRRSYAPDQSIPSWSDPKHVAHDLSPSLRGLEATVSKTLSSPGASLEIRRDGTVFFGCGFMEEEQDVYPEWVYAVWFSGLCLIRDLQKAFGLSELALVQAGMFGCGGRLVTSGVRTAYGRLENDSIILDTILVQEGWHPLAIFREWAAQFSNSLGLEGIIPGGPS